MSNLLFRSHSPVETARIGAALGRHAGPGDVFLLCGDLGAGKTCLTQGIASGLGITKEHVGSPTFILVSIHQGRLPLYHIDLYRLDHVAEVMELGLEEYLEAAGVSVVEWADKAPGVFPPHFLMVTLTFESETERLISLEPRGERYDRLVQKTQKELGEDGKLDSED
jgi:tRNA threonylcarbamoyladenosine biosynthesis protein TsaE